MIALSLLQTGCAVGPKVATPVTEFGAIGDGTTVNTKAIQSEIDQFASHGGGVVVVPKGTFVSGALFFKPGVDLRIDKDGVLKGSTKAADYPLVNTRWEGTEGMHTSAFINFDNGSHVTMSGEGTIDGASDEFPNFRTGQRFGAPGTQPAGGRGFGARGGFGGPATQPGARGARGGGGRGGFAGAGTRPGGAPAGSIRMANGFVFQQVGRPRLVCFKNCDNVNISGLNLRRQAIWCLHILYCKNVKIDGLNIDSVVGTPSSDGMDIDSSHDVEISNCTIRCNDDNISIKSGKDEDGRRVNRPSEHIWIHDCHFGLGDGLAMGSEVTGGVRHVLVEHCTFTYTNHCARIKSQPSRGGEVSDIIFRDIKLENATEAFDIELAWDLRLQRSPVATKLTDCHDIHLINFTGTCGRIGTFSGVQGGPLHDVHIVNCTFSARSGLRESNVADIDTSGLNVKVQQGPVIIAGQRGTTQPSNTNSN